MVGQGCPTYGESGNYVSVGGAPSPAKGPREVDIIIEPAVSYKEAEKKVVRIKVDDLTLPVISIDNLIKMKRKTGRAVDKLDIEELTKIKKLKKSI
ncbi:hypothetical protein AMJ44_13950 [candidate division WOR-1 bacterium DG_54_3]|uniref:Uncharacterized protein n=1 Tax=candidate division WOR-1 bacterium DG_54_3 TaxID=1703775 RepID=A0A0S7XNF6_UNCSA|nr:MAG: hypothetical protein AMJ44_13950 [candidate division WOR-1 bacterium DG_54_3]